MNHLSYSNVTATLALFIALGIGSAYAVDKIGSKQIAKDAVKSKHIKNKGVRSSELAPGAVKSANVADGSLLAEDFRAGQLPQGEPGAQGPPGEPATRLFASVRGIDGDLVYGSGAISSTRISTGRYIVTFNRSLDGCVAVATAGRGLPTGGTEDITQVGSRATVDMNEGPGEVEVFTAPLETTPAVADRSFLLAVFC